MAFDDTRAGAGALEPLAPPAAPTAASHPWLGLGVVTILAGLHSVHDLSHGYPRWLSVFTGALAVLQCAALSLGLAAARRWRAPRWAPWAGGVLVSVAFGLLIVVPDERGWHAPAAVVAAGGALVGLALGCLWLLLFQLPAALERSRLRALELEGLRRDAELARLRVHLHPHFLLNTLHAVAGLVADDPAEARRLLAALGDLVRDALDGGELQPFRAEAAWLRRYAEILEARYRGRLAFRWELAAETLDLRTPRLLLQPLVENAVKHGALRRPGGGTVRVASEVRDGGAVRFVVEDDGPGRPPGAADGLGVRLVRRRLALLCPGGALRFAPLAPGTRAVVELPRAPQEGAP